MSHLSLVLLLLFAVVLLLVLLDILRDPSGHSLHETERKRCVSITKIMKDMPYHLEMKN